MYSFTEISARFQAPVGILKHRLVILEGTNLVLADNQDILQANKLIAITKDTIFKNTYGKILYKAVIEDKKYNFNTGSPIFVGSLGELTQIVPTSGYIKIVGLPINNTTFIFNPESSIILS